MTIVNLLTGTFVIALSLQGIMANEMTPQAESSMSLEDLPTGQYYYAASGSADRPTKPSYVLLRKAGTTVIGLDHRSPNQASCFRGFIEGDQIVNATQVSPPYQPDSELRTGETLDLTEFQPVEHPISDEDTAALRTCMQFFWR